MATAVRSIPHPCKPSLISAAVPWRGRGRVRRVYVSEWAVPVDSLKSLSGVVVRLLFGEMKIFGQRNPRRDSARLSALCQGR